MIRMSEMVLAGHPDKFCDQVADAIVAAAMEFEPEAYAQVEVAAWCDRIWLNGGVATTRPLPFTLEEIVEQVVARVGYRDEHGAPRRYQVDASSVCLDVIDPRQWSHKVNDQSIVVGYAGYDEKTAYLPPEHYIAHQFREALEAAIDANGGRTGQRASRPLVTGVEPVTALSNDATLPGELPTQHSGHSTQDFTQSSVLSPHHSLLGPDGKLLVRLREDAAAWHLEHVLVTIQQSESANFVDVVEAVEAVLAKAYESVKERDPRWRGAWEDVTLLINPNGPLINGGSDGDNGQTGRKLVMDYYGPRVAIGGGALSGKHLTHIDRIGAYAAREAAIRAVRTGAKECRVVVAYAPNEPAPLDVIYEMTARGDRLPPSFFNHESMRDHYAAARITSAMPRGDHFLNREHVWNQ